MHQKSIELRRSYFMAVAEVARHHSMQATLAAEVLPHGHERRMLQKLALNFAERCTEWLKLHEEVK